MNCSKPVFSLLILLAGGLVFLGPGAGKLMAGSPRKVSLKVPFHKSKEANRCGVAALEMLADYYNQKLDDSQYRFLTMDATQDNGITGATMEVVLRASGYYTAIFQGTLDHSMTGIYRNLDLKRPLIVMVASEDGKEHHYAVMTGYDRDKKEVTLSDPSDQAEEVFSMDKFEAGWKRANYFTLLAVPKGQGASGTEPQD